MTSNWYAAHRFSLLLLAEVLLFVLHPLVLAVGFGAWLYHILFTLVFLAAFLILFNRPSRRLAAVALGLPALLASWVDHMPAELPGRPLAVALLLTGAAFLGLQTIHEAKVVTADGLAGAFGGYLLAGAAFTLLYSALVLIAPGSFRGPDELPGQLAEPVSRRMVLTYYSVMTLTTVGYGDIVPATHSARALACVEAVVGQFYIAVVMALLIGRSLAHAGGGDNSRAPGGSPH